MDDVTEVIVIEDDGQEDDIEEGEITDESDSEIEMIVVTPEPKKKKLPKRYCLHDKKVPAEKHKKDCFKHTRYSSHKSKNNVKSSPISNGVHKKHKSSCQLQRQKSYTGKNSVSKHIPPENNLPSPFSNDSSSKISAFKNFTSPPRPLVKPSLPSSDDNDNYSDMLLSYKKCREHLNHKNKSKDLVDLCRHSSSKNSSKSSVSKSQTKYSTNEKNSPRVIDTNRYSNEINFPKKSKSKHSLGEVTCPKKFEILSENLEPPKHEIKQSLNNQSPTKSVDDQSFCPPSNIDSKEPSNPDSSKSELEIQDDQEVYDLVEEDKEESEDEEELRRIALATCAMRALKKRRAEQMNIINNTEDSLSNQSSAASVVDDAQMNIINNAVDCFSNQSSVKSVVNGDNYEVVEMELDDEIFVENVEENLFFIDNNPAVSEFKQDKINGDVDLSTNNYLPPQQEDMYLSPNQAPYNEDSEEARLRAELIASINYKKKAVAIPKPDSAIITKLPKNTRKVNNVIPQSQILKPLVPYSNGQPFNSISTNIKRTDVVKLNNSKVPNSKKAIVPKPRNINATQERLIITLNNDSSSDESEEDESNIIEDNTVNSIDALISNARHNSDIKANGANLNHVSCLSKAQQEEYKKLRSLLAEKEPMTIIPLQPVKEKSTAENQNLNFLTNKISLAKEKLDKEMESLSSTQKEVLTKKRMFITSKLKFQHLQEQLHAAKLSKTANLKSWKLCEAKLVNAKNSVAKQKALISLLEAEFNSRQLQFDQDSSSPIL